MYMCVNRDKAVKSRVSTRYVCTDACRYVCRWLRSKVPGQVASEELLKSDEFVAAGAGFFAA